MNLLKQYWNQKPLALIMWLAFIVRIVAVVFAKGFGMLDDHFLVVEPPFSWVSGGNYDSWLPGGNNQGPLGFSMFYPGLQYLFFKLSNILGIHNPQLIMMINRFFHAIFSLITVYYGYKISEKLLNQNAAKMAGLLLAIYWFMPWMSVRNLVEMVCIPFLILGFWSIIKETDKRHFLHIFIGGLWFGLAFSVRYQTGLFILGTGIALLIAKKWRKVFILATGVVTIVAISQGLVDLLIWDIPFGQLKVYVDHNIHHALDYIVGPWYNYLLLLLGMLIPPISFFLFFGFLRSWKKHLILFLPMVLFLLFHSYFPNKQERFILPMVPFLIILGTVGWEEFRNRSKFWARNAKLLRASWTFFWILNIALLPFVTTMYSKRARVESMTYLSRYQDIGYLLFDDTFRGDIRIPPTFYLGQQPGILELHQNSPIDTLKSQLNVHGDIISPGFVLFFDDRDLDKRVGMVKEVLPEIVFEAAIKPGLVDKVLHTVNPINANETIIIYRNKEKYPFKVE